MNYEWLRRTLKKIRSKNRKNSKNQSEIVKCSHVHVKCGRRKPENTIERRQSKAAFDVTIISPVQTHLLYDAAKKSGIAVTAAGDKKYLHCAQTAIKLEFSSSRCH